MPADRKPERHRRVPGVRGARTTAVALLAAVLAVNSADTGTLGALAGQIEHDLHVDHAALGLLATVSAAVGVLLCVPAGVVADRVRRVPVLAATIGLWSVAMLAGALALSYQWLLFSRVALGGAIAASGPLVASLVGDLIPIGSRGRTYGWILTGELGGAGLGLVGSGWIASALSWRYAFGLLAVASAGLAVALVWLLPEPPRVESPRSGPPEPATGRGARPVSGGSAGSEPPLKEGARPDAGDGGPDPAAPLREGARPVAGDGPSAWQDAWYLLCIPTNRLLIMASALGYFFFAGLRTFAVVFAQDWYHVSLATVSSLIPVLGIGALAGVQAGGRIGDTARRRGHRRARVVVPAVAYLAAALLFAPGLLGGGVATALPLFTVGAAALAAANPPLDAARLDIVPGRLWGLAESLRTVVRLAAEAVAPLLFGVLADVIGGPHGRGLRDSFLIMLVPLAAGAGLTWWAAPGYPRDVAAARHPSR